MLINKWCYEKLLSFIDRNIDYSNINLIDYQYFLEKRDFRRSCIIYELNKTNIDFVVITILADFIYKSNISKIKMNDVILKELLIMKNCARLLSGISTMLSSFNGKKSNFFNKINYLYCINFRFMIEAYRVTEDIKNSFDYLIQKELLSCRLLNNNKDMLIKKI